MSNILLDSRTLQTITISSSGFACQLYRFVWSEYFHDEGIQPAETGKNWLETRVGNGKYIITSRTSSSSVFILTFVLFCCNVSMLWRKLNGARWNMINRKSVAGDYLKFDRRVNHGLILIIVWWGCLSISCGGNWPPVAQQDTQASYVEEDFEFTVISRIGLIQSVHKLRSSV